MSGMQHSGRVAVAERPAGPGTVLPDDPRYQELTVGFNQRWVGRPDCVRLATTTDEVVRAVQDAVDTGRRLSVVSGGHCLAPLVFNDEVRVVIDVSGLDAVSFDPRRRAFAVGAGARLGAVYDTLYKQWGVTVPGGMCPTVGVGGHVTGGGYGFLSRRFGSVVDQLEAVEVVVVDGSGTAAPIVASRDPGDPNHELWWMCAGGGGGNVGVVTRFWFRSEGGTGTDPAGLLPNPPKDVLFSGVGIPWTALDRDAFARLVGNWCGWYERHTDPADPATALSGVASLTHRSSGSVFLLTQLDATRPGAAELLDRYLAEVTAGLGVEAAVAAQPPARLPWLHSVRLIAAAIPAFINPTLRGASKSAFCKRTYTAEQAGAMYDALTRTDVANPASAVTLAGFVGGQVNTVDPADTAVAHRDSAFWTLFETQWQNPAEDAANVGWLRDLYGAVFARTGGFPGIDDDTDGCYVNNPDPDITDPAYNRSGIPWYTLYYKENYPLLQRIKAAYDPHDVFRHAQSVTAP
jgi:hypothetical protein